jgi:hypothetical protein
MNMPVLRYRAMARTALLAVLILLSGMATAGLGKTTILVRNQTDPVASELALSNYRMAILTNKGRALVLRNDTLQWEFMSSAALLSDHVLQRRAEFQTINSPETTHLFVEDRELDLNIMTPDSHIRRNGLGIQSHSVDSVEGNSNTTCNGSLSSSNADLYSMSCYTANDVDEYLNGEVRVEHRKYVIYYMYVRPKPDPDQGGAYGFRDLTQVTNIRLIMNRVTDTGARNDDHYVYGGYLGEGASYGVKHNVGNNHYNYGAIVQANYIPPFNLTQEELRGYAGTGFRKAHYSLGIKGSFTDVNGTYAFCNIWRVTETWPWHFDLTDKRNVYPYAADENSAWVECAIAVQGGGYLPLMTGQFDRAVYPDAIHPIYRALKQNKVTMAIVPNKLRASFVSDQLNGVSYLYLAKGNEWVEIPLSLPPGEEVELLSEAVYRLIPKDSE